MVDFLLERYSVLSFSLAGVEVLVVGTALERVLRIYCNCRKTGACSRFFTGYVHKQQGNTISCPERGRRNSGLQLVSKSAKIK